MLPSFACSLADLISWPVLFDILFNILTHGLINPLTGTIICPIVQTLVLQTCKCKRIIT